MARLVTSGAETADNTLEATSQGVTSTAFARTGSRSWLGTSATAFSFAGASGRSYFLRSYVYFDGAPFGDGKVLQFNVAIGSCRTASSGGNVVFRLHRDDTNAQIGSDSAPIMGGRWYEVQLRAKIAAGAADELELLVDGILVAVGTGLAISDTAPTGFQNSSESALTYHDDIALNDDQGASQASWPGMGKVALLLPISDNARAALWTGGTGGTTNLWDAVDNTPPVGTATETNTTQIEHAGGAAGTTDAYDANMTTPATAGIRSTDTINTAHFMEADGEDVATGAKLLNFEVLSNPVIASPGNVTAGDNVGALGTYPSSWSVRRSSPVYGSTLTVGTSPVMRARRPETASRVASVCFMGIYIDYTPGAMLPKQFSPVPFIPRGRNL